MAHLLLKHSLHILSKTLHSKLHVQTAHLLEQLS